MRFRLIAALLLSSLIFGYSLLSRQPTASPSHVIIHGSLHPRGLSVDLSEVDTVRVAFSVSQCVVDQRSFGGVRDDVILLEDAETGSPDGEFDVPVIRRLVAVPDGGEVRISTRVEKRTSVHDVVLRPKHKPAVTLDKTGGGVPARPSQLMCSVKYVGHLRDQRLALIEITPIQYDKHKKELNVATDLEVSLTVYDGRGPVLKNVGPMQSVLAGAVLNAESSVPQQPVRPQIRGERPHTTGAGVGQVCWATGSTWQAAATSAAACGPDYLIVVADSLASSAFVDSMALCRADKNGFNVAIVKVSQVDASPDTVDTPVAIRSLIDSVYTAQTAAHMADGHLGYVLLLGDAYDASDAVMLPSYYGYANSAIAPTSENDKFRASDAYYSFLDSDPAVDRLPDVLIGRLPIDKDSTGWEISNLVRKIVRYEPLPSAAWADSVLMISGSDPSGFSFQSQALTGFENFFDSVSTLYPPMGRQAAQMHRLAYGAPSDSTTHRIFGNKVAASMKRGKWLTAYFDHGSPFYWVGAFYARSFETFSTVTSKPSIVFSIGSNTCQFDLTAHWGRAVFGSCSVGQGCMVSPPSSIQCESPGYQSLDKCDVVAERILVQPGGAVGVIGYSRTQVATSAQTDFTNLFRSLADQNPSTLGQVLVGARMFNIANDVTVRNLMLLGDPALDIRTRAPAPADTFDVAVGTSDIKSPWGAYIRDGSSPISVTVHNTWRVDAPHVEVELWAGHPDSSSSTLLSSVVIDTVHAYGATKANLTASGLDGNVEVFVRIDPDNELSERSEANNLASRHFTACPYEGNFPARLPIAASRAITVADLKAIPGKEFLVTGETSAQEMKMQCFSASDTLPVWTLSPDSTFINYSTPAVGHVYKSSRSYAAFQYGHPLKVRLISGESGSVVKTRLSNDRSVFTSSGVAAWSISDFGADDAAMELTTLLYRDHSGLDTLFLTAFAPSGTRISPAIVDVGFSLSPATLALGDINKDGTREVVAYSKYANNGDELKVFSCNGTSFSQLWGGDVSDGTGSNTPALALIDRDGDGNVEILCNGHYFSGSFLRMYTASGGLQWSNDVSITDPHTFSAGDIDGDGAAEVVVADHQRLRILSSSSGSVLDTKTMVGDPVSPPYLVDVDNDGKLNVIVMYQAIDSNAYFFPRPYHVSLYVLDENLDPFGPVHTFSSASVSQSVPAIEDLDGDGTYEMVYASADQYLHVFKLGATAGRAAWPQRFANELQNSLYEQPITGHYNNPVSLFQKTRMLGDVELDSTLAPSLYIGHGTQVQIDGSTSSPPSLRVFGSVRVKGSEASPVLLGTVPSASSLATWRGLYINDRASTTSDPDTISRAQISDATIGIEVLSPVVVKTSAIENTFNAGVWSEDWLDLRDCTVVAGTGDGIFLGASAADVAITHCTVTDCAEIGINSYPSGTVAIDSTSVANADIGIKARHGTVILSDSDVRDCSSDGLYVGKTESLSATGSLFSGNDTGVHVAYQVDASFSECSFLHNVDGFLIISGDTTLADISRCRADSNTTSGLYIGENYAVTPGSVVITRNTVAHNAVGIYAYGAAPEIRTRNVIQYNSTGIKCDNNTYAAVESCTVTDNSYGVNVVSGDPDLGHVSGGTSTGYNILKPNSSKYVKNTTGNTISAEQNYWPQTDTCQPRLSFISGSFDVSDALCDAPELNSMGYLQTAQKHDVPRTFALAQNYPNPFNPTTSITFDVPSTSRVRIAVYDVGGRLVTVLVDEQKLPGKYQVTWNGSDRHGQVVATGVYFLKMQAGRFMGTKKLVLLK